MVQIIPPKNLSGFGQLVQGFANQANSTLSQSLPKYIEQGMLRQGLKQFEQESANLSPMEQLTRLSSIPGITPQMVQSFGDLARQQGIKQSLGRSGGGLPQPQAVQSPQGPSYKDVQFGNFREGQPSKMGAEPVMVGKSQEPGLNQLGPANPTRPEALPYKPISQQQRDAEMFQDSQQNPYLSFPELQSRQSQREQIRNQQSAAERERDAYQSQKKQEAENAFTKALETRLQKQGTDVFKDIPGAMIYNTQRAMDRYIAENPNVTIEDAADKFSNSLYNTAQSKSQLKGLANRTIWDQLFKHDQTVDKLKRYQKSFSESGNLEEFYNILKSSNNPETGSFGFDMSPQYAASIAYPLNKELNSSLKKLGKRKGEETTQDYARRAAILVENSLSDSDSVLAAAYKLRQMDPIFDQKAFFNQLDNDADHFRLNDRIKRELSQGESAYTPQWGDSWFVNILGGE